MERKEEEKEKELHDEFYKIAGISRETVWIQRSPPESGAPDLEVLCIETKDPSMTYREFATSIYPRAVKFRQYAKRAYGIDFAGLLPPLNESIVDWREQE